MSLSFGRPMVAIPGPSIVPDRVLAAMHRPMPNIYSGELPDLAYELIDELPAIARTEGRAFVSISNGHGAWQMAICNTLSRDDTVLVLESGRFATIWGEMAALSGVRIETVPGDTRRGVDPEAVTAHLVDDTERRIKAILMVQTDTSTSVRNDISAVRGAIDAADHPALLFVDCIASLGCERFEMDAWGVDIAVAGSQKGLMVPPGLSFCWANDKALAAYETADLRVGYLDWAPRLKPEAPYFLFAGTPPIGHLYGLREALDMIAEEGLENVWHRHEVLAGAVHAAIDAWSTPDGIDFNIIDPAARSNAVTTVLTGTIDADELRQVAEDQTGLVLGLGIGGPGQPRFRIGHMGHLNPPMLLGTLGSIEAVLISMGAPMGASGVQAAAAHIATAI